MAEPIAGIELDLAAIVETFRAEAEEGLAAMEVALVELESHPTDAEGLRTVFRVAHTLKGNAVSLGFTRIADLAHDLEDVLAALRSGSRPLSPALVTLILEAVDALRAVTRREATPLAVAGDEPLDPRVDELRTRLRAAAARTTEPTPRAPRGAGDGAPPPSASATVRPIGPPPAPRPERRESPGRRQEDTERERTLRVGLDVLDELLNLTGEIAIAQGRLTQALAVRGQAGEAADAHSEAERLFGDLQELVMRARLVPLGPVFRRQARVVRDLAASRGKLARLAVAGEDVEVDTAIAERIKDPLTHMVRNAIDHGLESPTDRAAAGKDPCGTVTLSARREAGSIVIEVADDGAGLDRARILARAREGGLLAEGAVPSDDDVLRLIFEPGFSTAAAVSELSGRGVGLDVVQRNVAALRGTVAVESEPGAGTRLTLRLPLTLAVISGLNVRVGSETFVIPLDSVVECLELPAGEGPHDDGRGVVNLRGHGLPYVSLAHLFGLGTSAERREVVVVRAEEGLAGLAVDGVRGEGQAVIKPLGKLFQGIHGVSGASIQGDGRVALILDVPAIVRRGQERAAGREARRAEEEDGLRIDAEGPREGNPC